MTRAHLAGAALFALTSGCSLVSSSVSGQNIVSGEAWYVRTNYVLFIPIGSDVYYCPAPTGPGSVKCKQATMIDDPVLAAESHAPPATTPPPLATAPAPPSPVEHK